MVDNASNIWIGTNKGISVLTNDENIRSYYDDHAINNIEYFAQSSLKDNKGLIYFGGNNGFHYFEPFRNELLKSQQLINKPILSNLLIANKPISTPQKGKNQNYTLPAQLNNLSLIKLKYIHSPFSIEFVSPNAKLPNQMGYRYKLLGSDENWLETDH